MNKMVIVADSCSDLSQKQVEQMEIQIIPLSVELEGKTYRHYPDERELKITTFY
ncbi:MAG: fatty acid-binding protein DegV, partial [Tenericutes bacterium HGW-Tenericutes-3]